MKVKKTLMMVISLLIITVNCFCQDYQWERTYEFGIYNNYDLRNSSQNAIGTYRVLNDGFDSLVVSHMNPLAGSITKGVFNFTTIYLTMLWSHEMGHFIRAKQVGGTYNPNLFNKMGFGTKI